MNNEIKITKQILNEKVPVEFIPKRVTSATSLYVNIDIDNQQGLLLYYPNPKWNLWYPFNIINTKFMTEDCNFKEGITYQELIEEFEKIFQKSEEVYSKEQRKEDLRKEYQELYQLEQVEVGEELEPIYEIKYSKTTNIYSMYKHEGFVLKTVSNKRKLLEDIKYHHTVVPIELPEEVNNIKLVGNIKDTLDNQKNRKIIEQNVITDTQK